ncbi:MAG: radical SAM/SPASM domain-containing protein [Candidatus Falkowbacteria bacterium]
MENVNNYEVSGPKLLLKRIKRAIKSNQKLYISLWRTRLFFINTYLKCFKNFRSIEIETNPICNRRCSFCPITLDKHPIIELMSEDLFDKIVNELKERHFKGEVCLSSYGEPLLDKRLAGFAKKIKTEIGSKVVVFTNGDFLTVEKFRELLSAGVDLFYMSQHDEVLPEIIQKLFAEISSAERKHIDFSVIKEDSPLVNRGGTVEVKTLQQIVRCPLRKMYIRADGEVRLCCNDYFREVKLGNVNESKLIDIWDSSVYKKIRKELESNVFSQDVCKRCLGTTSLENKK